MKTIPEMLSVVAKQNANRTAVVDGGIAINYATLEKRIISVAAKLDSMGVRRGDRIALLLPNGLDFVKSYFGIVALGAIAVPLNDHYQKTELLYFLKDCGVSLIITSQSFAQLCHQVLSMCESPCKLFFVDDQTEASEDELKSLGDLKVGIDPDVPVMYQFSSGSTGRPKRVARTHANLIFELNSFHQTLNLTNEDRFLGVAPFSHVNGLMRSMMASIRAGATLYPLARFERHAVAEVLEKNSISIFIGVPFMFTMLSKARFHRRPDFSALRLCVSASAPMPKKLNQQFYENFGMHVRQLYGSTETGTISVNLSSNTERSLESVGTPIAGVEVEIFTEDGQVAKTGEMGEIAVKSPAAIKGYDGLDEINKETFRNDLFFTGDIGRKEDDGLLYLVGRKKFFINRGGYKIDPREIEELLESHPKVEEAIVLGVPTPFGDEKGKAVIVLNAPGTEEEIIEYCRGKIADFKIPSLVEFRDTLPKSPTGKIRRKMLIQE
ncbi:MAG: acyl--CoA ligase [Deltaproteobacteria bacterium]|nr:acyl--CoA ligase [Deltaproteobacteria bacterium]